MNSMPPPETMKVLKPFAHRRRAIPCFVLLSVQFCRACWVLYIGLYGNAMRCPEVIFLSIIWVRHRGCFLFHEQFGNCVRLGSSSAFADSFAVYCNSYSHWTMVPYT